MRRLIMRLAWRCVVAVLVPVAGCGGLNASARSEADARPEIAIQRGATWSTLSFAPPRIIGPSVQLELSNGGLRGFAGGGAMDVHIGNGEASGFGPNGPVSISVENHDGQTLVGGMWNGGTVHFTFAAGELHGSVIRRSGGRRLAGEQSCGYELGGTDARGALVGTSTCGGMPQATRLEIDPRVPRLMTSTELAVVLVAALAAPPMTDERL
jgi:hypothetical protein